MRINCTDEEQFTGQFDLFEANIRRSINGRRGQKALHELRDVLLAMPNKRLIKGDLEHDGEFCAIGAYAKAKGVDLANFDPEDDNHDEAGVEAGMPYLVAWKVVWENDEGAPWTQWRNRETAEARYERMLAWVELQLAEPPNTTQKQLESANKSR